MKRDLIIRLEFPTVVGFKDKSLSLGNYYVQHILSKYEPVEEIDDIKSVDYISSLEISGDKIKILINNRFVTFSFDESLSKEEKDNILDIAIEKLMSIYEIGGFNTIGFQFNKKLFLNIPVIDAVKKYFYPQEGSFLYTKFDTHSLIDYDIVASFKNEDYIYHITISPMITSKKEYIKVFMQVEFSGENLDIKIVHDFEKIRIQFNEYYARLIEGIEESSLE